MQEFYMDFWNCAISVKMKKVGNEANMQMAEVTVGYAEWKAIRSEHGD